MLRWSNAAGDAALGTSGSTGPASPWEAFGPAVADSLRPSVERIVDDVLAAVVEAVPPFQEWLVGSRNLRLGVEQGLHGFLELLESGDVGLPRSREVYFDFGRGELRAGRSIDAVLTAYRAAAQVTWRGMAEAGHAAGLEPRTLYRLAEAIFAYMDRMSTATAEGFAYERSLRAGERRDRRRRLVELLLRVPPAPAVELESDAQAIGWRLAPTLAVVAFPDERVTRMAARLPADALVARLGHMGYAVVPDPDAPGRRATLEHSLRDVRAALGPSVAPSAAAESARLARLALSLPAPGEARGLVIAQERRVDLLLLGDPALAELLIGDVLGPLAALPAGARARLLETLAAWLRHQGEVRPVAEELHVHAQTVRYRLGQLRALVGERMGSPDGRLELELALRASFIRGQRTEGRGQSEALPSAFCLPPSAS